MLCDAHESYQSGARLDRCRQSPPQLPWCTARRPACGRTRPCRWSSGAARRTALWLSLGWLESACDCRGETWSGTNRARSGSRCRPCAAAGLSGRRSPGGLWFGVSWVVLLYGGQGFAPNLAPRALLTSKRAIIFIPYARHRVAMAWRISASPFSVRNFTQHSFQQRLVPLRILAQLLALGLQGFVVAEHNHRRVTSLQDLGFSATENTHGVKSCRPTCILAALIA